MIPPPDIPQHPNRERARGRRPDAVPGVSPTAGSGRSGPCRSCHGRTGNWRLDTGNWLGQTRKSVPNRGSHLARILAQL